jgi:hypothetical protein
MSKIYVAATDARNKTKINSAYVVPENRSVVFLRHDKAILKINEATYEEVGGIPTFKGTITVDDFGFTPPSGISRRYRLKFFYTEGATGITIAV